MIGGEIGYQILRRISRKGENRYIDGSSFEGRSKLQTLLGPEIWDKIGGRVVIDFGCGHGVEAIELAQRGAAHVIALDIQERFLSEGRAAAERAGVEDRCEFSIGTDKKADIIISLDAFEHFANPEEILVQMHRLLKLNGRVVTAFGPTWYHPFGGHLFSVFPWAHLLFSEGALIRWRSEFKDDGATCFAEVAGGLNMMTISRFEQIVKKSPLEFEYLELVPIRKLTPFSGRLTREWTTAVVRAILKDKGN